MPKKILIAMPQGLLEELDEIAEQEHRTRSDAVREAIRRYLAAARQFLQKTEYA